MSAIDNVKINRSTISRIIKLLPSSIFNTEDSVGLLNADGTEIYLIGDNDDYTNKIILIEGVPYYFQTNIINENTILVGETIEATLRNLIDALNVNNDPSFTYSAVLNRENALGTAPEYLITIYYKQVSVGFPKVDGVRGYSRYTTTSLKIPDFDPLEASATLDESITFGPTLINATPQHAIARIINNEANRVALAIEIAKALQLAPIDVDGAAYAENEDLDRIGAQFGIGRPYGFSDKNYWKLIKLIQFTPGFTVNKLLDICELYYGSRPDIIQLVNGYTIRWPQPAQWFTYFRDGSAIDTIDKHYGRSGTFARKPLLPGEKYDETYDQVVITIGDVGSFFDYETAWSEYEPIGMNNTLQDVISANSPAGVFVRYENLDSIFSLGAYGETKIRRIKNSEGVYK